MAFSSTFKPLQNHNQLHHPYTLFNNFPSSLSSNLNTFQHGFSISSPKIPPLLQMHAHITTHSQTNSSPTNQEHSKPTISRRILDKIQQGFSSFDSKNENLGHLETKPVENNNLGNKVEVSRSRVDGKKMRDNGSKERIYKTVNLETKSSENNNLGKKVKDSRNRVDSKKVRYDGSKERIYKTVNLETKSSENNNLGKKVKDSRNRVDSKKMRYDGSKEKINKNVNLETKSSENNNLGNKVSDSRNRVDGKKMRDNGSKEKINKNVNLDEKDEGVGKRLKKSKKGKFDSPVVVVRIGLEICSKLGDVMGAIGIFDLAKREGINLGQYHYAVILYLCSSAAVGVVQPAKSGRTDSNSGLNSNVKRGNVEEQTHKLDTVCQSLDGLIRFIEKHENSVVRTEIKVGEDVKEYALKRGFEIYEEMVSDEVPMNEAILTSLARMAMSRDDGDMAFELVKQMKDLGINPRLRSYGPALSVFCKNGNLEKAFEIEEHMLEHGVYPEEPELELLLSVSIEANRGDKVYYLLHKLRTSVRKVSPSTARLIEKWFKSRTASRIGKRKWDQKLINQAVENGGGGWHGQGWLGSGKWSVVRSVVGKDGLCQCCGEKLATIDLDPIETERFAESVAKIARERERNSSFEKFQKWLDYYGPFEAVVDGANVGLFSQRRFKPSKVNTIANGIRQRLPSKRWPLVILHNRRITGDKMDEGLNKTLVEKWKNADALYATPTGSNDDWYWLYAAIKFKCLLVTNDEMRDHLFQLLGNDFFPKWKERHQVRFHFSETGPVYRMPPPCSVVIQESRKGDWHIPIASEEDSEDERAWICVTRDKSSKNSQHHTKVTEGFTKTRGNYKNTTQEICRSLEEIMLSSFQLNQDTVLTQIMAAEKVGDCVIDFHI